MEVRIEALEGSALPPGCYIGVRLGEVLKQGRYEPQRIYNFGAVDRRKNAKIDIFQHVGSCVVAVDPDARSTHEVCVTNTDPAYAGMRIRVATQAKRGDEPLKPPRAERVTAMKNKAKEYLSRHGIEERLSEAVKALLKEQPEDPTAFLLHQLAQAPPPQVQQAAPERPQQALPFAEYYRRHFPACPLGACHARFPPRPAGQQPGPGGSGGRAQARGAPADGELLELRARAKEALAKSCLSGELEGILAELQRGAGEDLDGPPPPPPGAEEAGGGPGLAALRARARGALLAACEEEPEEAAAAKCARPPSAAAEEKEEPEEADAAKCAPPPAAAEEKAEELAAVRLRVRKALILAADREALEPGAEEDPEAELDRMRNKARAMLAQAASNGELQQALMAIAGNQDQVASLRAKTRSALAQACEDGSLTRALKEGREEVARARLASGGADDAEELRLKAELAASLRNAAATGELARVLELTRAEEQAEKRREGLALLRSRASTALAEACSDGSLGAAVRAARQGEASPRKPGAEAYARGGFAPTAQRREEESLEAVRATAAEALWKASSDGGLFAALESVRRERRPEGEAAASRLETVRTKAKEALIQATTSGALERAVERAAIETARMRTAAVLKEGLESGALANALLAALAAGSSGGGGRG